MQKQWHPLLDINTPSKPGKTLCKALKIKPVPEEEPVPDDDDDEEIIRPPMFQMDKPLGNHNHGVIPQLSSPVNLVKRAQQKNPVPPPGVQKRFVPLDFEIPIPSKRVRASTPDLSANSPQSPPSSGPRTPTPLPGEHDGISIDPQLHLAQPRTPPNRISRRPATPGAPSLAEKYAMLSPGTGNSVTPSTPTPLSGEHDGIIIDPQLLQMTEPHTPPNRISRGPATPGAPSHAEQYIVLPTGSGSLVTSTGRRIQSRDETGRFADPRSLFNPNHTPTPQARDSAGKFVRGWRKTY